MLGKLSKLFKTPLTPHMSERLLRRRFQHLAESVAITLGYVLTECCRTRKNAEKIEMNLTQL